MSFAQADAQRMDIAQSSDEALARDLDANPTGLGYFAPAAPTTPMFYPCHLRPRSHNPRIGTESYSAKSAKVLSNTNTGRSA